MPLVHSFLSMKKKTTTRTIKMAEEEYTEYKESRKPRECRPGMRWGSQTGIGEALMVEEAGKGKEKVEPSTRKTWIEWKRIIGMEVNKANIGVERKREKAGMNDLRM